MEVILKSNFLKQFMIKATHWYSVHVWPSEIGFVTSNLYRAIVLVL